MKSKHEIENEEYFIKGNKTIQTNINPQVFHRI